MRPRFLQTGSNLPPTEFDLFGKIDIQRIFYWHIFKAFYRPDMTLDELNHLNFDWYTPRNAHRQAPEQVRTWCSEIALEIEHECIEQAGITIIGRKEGVL